MNVVSILLSPLSWNPRLSLSGPKLYYAYMVASSIAISNTDGTWRLPAQAKNKEMQLCFHSRDNLVFVREGNAE